MPRTQRKRLTEVEIVLDQKDLEAMIREGATRLAPELADARGMNLVAKVTGSGRLKSVTITAVCEQKLAAGPSAGPGGQAGAST